MRNSVSFFCRKKRGSVSCLAIILASILAPILAPILAIIFALVASACLAVAAGAQSLPRSLPLSSSARLDFVRIGTGPAEKTLYRLGSALTGSLSAPPGIKPPCRKGTPCGVPGLLLVAQSRSGAFESLEDMARGRLESALVTADVLEEVNAFGLTTYSFDMREVLLIARLSAIQLHVVVLASSPVAKLADLVGRTVAVGLSGSASSLHLYRALESEGVAGEGIAVVGLSFADGLAALKAGQVEALVVSGQAPMTEITALAPLLAIRLLDVAPQGSPLQNASKAHLGIASPTVLSADTYPEQKRVWHTLSFDVLWVVSRNVSEEVVYRLTRSLWHGSTQDIMRTLVPEMRIDRPYRYRSALLPLHPGAARWYEEQGLLAL